MFEKKTVIICLCLVYCVLAVHVAIAEEPPAEPEPGDVNIEGTVALDDDAPRLLPAYVVTWDGDTDVGVFTTILEVESRMWKGHQYRVGTFTGANLAGPGFTISIFEGKFRGNPAEISAGLFYLAKYKDLTDGKGALSTGITVRVKF